jgi:hypothetical protein
LSKTERNGTEVVEVHCIIIYRVIGGFRQSYSKHYPSSVDLNYSVSTTRSASAVDSRSTLLRQSVPLIHCQGKCLLWMRQMSMRKICGEKNEALLVAQI